MAFRIEASAPPEEWAQAEETRGREPPGSQYDQARAPRYDLLNADLQLSQDGRELFPAGPGSERPGYSISLLDLVLGLDDVLGDLDGPTTFSQADDDLRLTLERRNGTVRLSTNLDRSPLLEVPAGEFFAEWRRFRDSFLVELRDRAPELLDWETLAPLR
jgi:hypothetical protein